MSKNFGPWIAATGHGVPVEIAPGMWLDVMGKSIGGRTLHQTGIVRTMKGEAWKSWYSKYFGEWNSAGSHRVGSVVFYRIGRLASPKEMAAARRRTAARKSAVVQA